jgi:hypothetical protein
VPLELNLYNRELKKQAQFLPVTLKQVFQLDNAKNFK